MEQLLTGISSYITSWRAPFAVVVLLLAIASWLADHHARALIIACIGLALFFSVNTLVGQFGFG